MYELRYPMAHKLSSYKWRTYLVAPWKKISYLAHSFNVRILVPTLFILRRNL